MKPHAIPVAIEYDNGIIIIVINAGTANSNFFQSISAKFPAISTPTTINAGAVTALVTTAINGLKNNASKKQTPVTILANPVRAPTATPEVDSIYEVVVVVPKIAPIIVAIESENNARPARGSYYLSSYLLELQQQPMYLLYQRSR